ncbi:MAG: 5-oxoprolinase subunit PxpB [Anaerolineae bacterium]|nr:5-oxoprolinase subunit PxpB [Anaerolineae bacterium]
MKSAGHLSASRFLLAGDAALVVEFGDAIDPEINRRVHALARALAENPLPGLGESVPSYRSLLVHYDPLRLSHAEVESFVSEALRRCEDAPLPEPRLVEIPTVYGGERGPDIGFVAGHNSLTVADVIRLHSEAIYTVYMLGFTPGFPYLGGLPDALFTPRLETPRQRVPAGSVGIAGAQTGVYPLATPGGWRLIGWTPLALFDPARTPPALLRPGDRVRFVPTEEASLGA